MTGITFDEKTNTGSINLLSNARYFEWEDLRKNKNLIRIMLDELGNFDEKIKEKILGDNRDYL
jgi:hypothetical protein